MRRSPVHTKSLTSSEVCDADVFDVISLSSLRDNVRHIGDMASCFASFVRFGFFVSPPKSHRVVQDVAHVQPSGSGGRSAVFGAAGSLYLPRPCQFWRRSVRMRASSASPVSNFDFRFPFLASSASVGTRLPFAGGFEDGGAVAFEVGLHPPQRHHPRLQPRELLLNLRHNPPLLWNRRDRKLNFAKHRAVNIWLADAAFAAFNLPPIIRALKKCREITRVHVRRNANTNQIRCEHRFGAFANRKLFPVVAPVRANTKSPDDS